MRHWVSALSQAWNDRQGAIHGFASLVTSTIDLVISYVVNRWHTLRSALSHPLDAIINFPDHGYVIGGNVISGEQQATQMRMLEGFSTSGAQVDTSGINESINRIPPSAMETSSGLQMTAPSVTQLATAIPLDRSSRAIALWQQAGQILGVYDGDRELLGGTNFSFSPSTSSSVNITINVTVNGNADKNVVRRRVEESLLRIESFASQFASYQRERQRRSFA